MSKKCIFCNKPILSDYASKVYLHIKEVERTTARQLSENLDMTPQMANNYLMLLQQLDLIKRERLFKVWTYEINSGAQHG